MGLTVGLASPLFGQETQAVSAAVRSQVEAVFLQFQNAYNTRGCRGDCCHGDTGCGWLRSFGELSLGKQAVVGRFLQDFRDNPGQNGEQDPAMYPVGPDGVCVITDSHVGTMHFQTMTFMCVRAKCGNRRWLYLGAICSAWEHVERVYGYCAGNILKMRITCESIGDYCKISANNKLRALLSVSKRN